MKLTRQVRRDAERRIDKMARAKGPSGKPNPAGNRHHRRYMQAPTVVKLMWATVFKKLGWV